jgi:uncharacterized protein (DUF3820 family)
VTIVSTAEITTIDQCHISLHVLKPFPFTCKLTLPQKSISSKHHNILISSGKYSFPKTKFQIVKKIPQKHVHWFSKNEVPKHQISTMSQQITQNLLDGIFHKFSFQKPNFNHVTTNILKNISMGTSDKFSFPKLNFNQVTTKHLDEFPIFSFS